MSIPRRVLEEKFRRFVEDDIGHGDITALCTIPQGTIVEAEMVAKEAGVTAGVEEAAIFLESFGLKPRVLVSDGRKVEEKTRVLEIVGDARTLLSIERTLLNLVSRMSGIATTTQRLVEKVKLAGYKARVACTRKVAPGLSYFDKRAVMVGGGDTHRLGLDDMVLIKDNHIVITGDVGKAVKMTKDVISFSKKIEVEASTVDEALEAAKAGADIIMFDNFTPKQVRKAMALLKRQGLRNKVLVEASGGISEQNILEYAAAGVNIISLGEITHSAKALDMSLEITKVRKKKE